MSIAVLKKKSEVRNKSLTGDSIGKVNKFVNNIDFCCGDNSKFQAINSGSIFSLNGRYRDITPTKKDYKMSVGGTKYITVYDKHNRYVVPVGNGGNNGRYPRVVSFNLERCCADNTDTINPSVLDNKYLVNKQARLNNVYKKFPVKKDEKVVSYKNKWIVSNDNKDYNGGYNKRLKDKEVKLVTDVEKLLLDNSPNTKEFGNSSFHNKQWFNTFSRGYNNAYLKTYKDQQVLLNKNKECINDCKNNK